MARLPEEFKDRVESFCDRVVHVARSLEDDRSLRRIVDQMMGCGTSVGANVFEADEAMSRADFVKCLCIATKELNETVFWIRLVARNNWLRADRLQGLEAERGELKRILGSMISRTIRRKAHPAPAL